MDNCIAWLRDADHKVAVCWPTGVIIWFGGPLVARVHGDLRGIEAELVMNLNLPANDDLKSYNDPLLHPAGEWVHLSTIDEQTKKIVFEHVNPCAIALRLTFPDAPAPEDVNFTVDLGQR